MHANIQSKSTELGQVARNAEDAQREECKEIFGGAEAMRDGQRFTKWLSIQGDPDALPSLSLRRMRGKLRDE